MDWRIIESRVDWLTVTADHDHGAIDLLQAAIDVAAEEVQGGERRRPWFWQGYRGSSTGSVSYGWRLDGAICRLSGARAGLHWRPISNVAWHTTRIDLCVTAVCTDDPTELASACYNDAISSAKQARRPTEFTLLRARIGGQTLYCGRRVHNRFGRLYDKCAESDLDYPRGSWRWELELKGELAQQTLWLLRQSDVVEEQVGVIVASEFARWGVPPPWSPYNCVFHLEEAPKPVPDRDRVLAWLRSTVAPAVERLSTQCTEEEILRELGIWYQDGKPIGSVDEAMEQRLRAHPDIVDANDDDENLATT